MAVSQTLKVICADITRQELPQYQSSEMNQNGKAFPYMEGTDLASDIDQGFEDLAQRVADVGVLFSQGVFASRPAASAWGGGGALYLATDTSVLYYTDGTAWFDFQDLLPPTEIVNADVAAAAAIGYSKLDLALGIVNADINTSADIAITKLKNGTAVTSVPSSPSSQDEFVYRFTDLLAYVHEWRFKYYSVDSRWHFLGGNPKAAANTAVGFTRSDITYGAALANVNITVPLTGRYKIRWGGQMRGSGVDYVTAGVHVNGVLQTEGEINGPTAAVNSPVTFETGRNGNQLLTAGDVVDVRLKCSGVSVCTVDYPFLEIVPMSLGT